MIKIAHNHDVPFLVDAAQSIPHMAVDVKDLDADFLVFSGHKVYGPTGVGVLYGKEEWLDKLPPYQGGGEMIKHVSLNVLPSMNYRLSSKPVLLTISVLRDWRKLSIMFLPLAWIRLPLMSMN